MRTHTAIINELVDALVPLEFGGRVTHVYNPLVYARKPYEMYLRRYGGSPKEVVLVGMNPGPWGMAQTGVPFGEVGAVRNWLKIEGPVDRPPVEHPKRPVDGFQCRRSEVSGRRLWGWAQNTFQTPDIFFRRFFVANYCPLIFMEQSGKNRPPSNLPVGDRKKFQPPCDHALRRLIQYLSPRMVVGVGNFSAARVEAALQGLNVSIGKITHPSPANPRANKDWEGAIVSEFKALGIYL